MIDEDPDWISLDAAVALGETTLQCYRERAVELMRQAVDNLKVKSRTVKSSPRWIVSEVAGAEIFHSDGGKRVEVCRKDVVEFCSELRTTATRSFPPKSKSALWNNVTSAIADLWPDEEITVRAKDRNKKIHDWLRFHGIIGKFEDVSRTIQRVLKAKREGHG
jgi:hypothetical protein